MMGACLLLALLFAIYLSELVSCCNRKALMNCHDGQYNGTIRTIVDTGPSDIAKASDDRAADLLSYVQPIFSTVIGQVLPYSDLVFGVIDGIIAAIGGGSTQDPYSALLQTLYEEIERLKAYVDSKIELAALIDLDNDLGSKHAGIFGRVEDTKYAETTEELWDELDQLHGALQDAHDHFVPSTDSIISYEASLPYFRVFGDLLITCLLDQIQAAKALGYTSKVAYIAEEIQDRANIFYSHYITAIRTIIKDHTSLEEPKCTEHLYIVPSGWWIFTTYTTYADIKCTVEMGDKICSIESTECTDANEENILKELLKDKMDTFKTNRRIDLSNYWFDQVGYVAYNWNGIANKVENQVALM